MVIKNINLTNFRNHKNLYISVSSGVNIFIGENAQGKTNIIEAIYLCVNGRLNKTRTHKDLINWDTKSSTIKLNTQNKITENQLSCSVNDDKLDFYINGKKRVFNSRETKTIFFSPKDLNILQGSPDIRRAFLDETCELMFPNYKYYRINFYRALKQRNALLKQNKNLNNVKMLVNTFDSQISKFGALIFHKRAEIIGYINKHLTNIFNKTTERHESALINYAPGFPHENCNYKDLSSLEEAFTSSLIKNIDNDIIYGTTSTGPQKDDFNICINNKNCKSFSSQGDQRTLVVALKICQLLLLKEERDDIPILLLDDVMSELDEKRQCLLLDIVKECEQVFITTTDHSFIKKVGLPVNVYIVDKGKCCHIGKN